MHGIDYYLENLFSFFIFLNFSFNMVYIVSIKFFFVFKALQNILKLGYSFFNLIVFKINISKYFSITAKSDMIFLP